MADLLCGAEEDRLSDTGRTLARICASWLAQQPPHRNQDEEGDESASQVEYAGSIPVIGSTLNCANTAFALVGSLVETADTRRFGR